MAIISHSLSVVILLLLTNVVYCIKSSSQIPLSDSNCKHPPYTIHIFSKSPLVIYISNFLTPEERLHLQEISYVRSSINSLNDTSN